MTSGELVKLGGISNFLENAFWTLPPPPPGAWTALDPENVTPNLTRQFKLNIIICVEKCLSCKKLIAGVGWVGPISVR